MQHAAPVRRQLGHRTIFNLLGPLTNPAGADFQILGAGRIAIAEKIAGAAARLGTKRTLVVCGNDELDEVSLWGRTAVFHIEGEAVRQYEWTAEQLGLPECRVSDLTAESPAESAEIIRRLLAGERGAARDLVLANTAAALIAAGRTAAPREAVEIGTEAIDSGAASTLLRRLMESTNAA
jgi:anthranilate phosphoribosyltransferase